MSVGYSTAFENISAEIGYNAEFLNAALAIQTNLSEISDENESIQAGQSTITTNLPILISELQSNVDFCLKNFITTFLTEEDQNCYLSGGCFIDNIVSRDLVVFYNSLQKVNRYSTALQGTLNTIPHIPDIKLSGNSNEYKLTEEEFEENVNNVSNTTNFRYYTVLDGDTARSIALKELNDQSKFTTIMRLNDIGEDDFIEGTIVGSKIKIPIDINASARGSDNLVYSRHIENPEEYQFGTDLFVSEKKLKVSETGDLLSVSGIENAYRNIEDRITSIKGSLGVSASDWGTTSLDDGNSPFLVKLDRYITDVSTQIQSDPRVESVNLDTKNIKLEGSTLSLKSKVFFTGVEEPVEVSV